MKALFFIMLLCMLHSAQASNVFDSAYNEKVFVQPLPRIQLKFPYNINTDYVVTTLVNTGTVTQSSNLAVVQTGTSATGSATLQSKDRLGYKPGQGTACLCTAIFTPGVANNTQIIGVGNAQDGFFFGYNGTSFGVMRRSNGTDTWISQTNWNGDNFDGTGLTGITLDPTQGNLYKIQYQWLGFGAIKFFIENPITGEFVLVHTIQYANANTTPSLRNPGMQLMAATTNTGNTTNITLQTASMVGMIEGKLNPYTDVRNSTFNNKNIRTTLTNIVTIQNKSTYQGVNNQVLVFPDFLTIMNISAGTNSMAVSLYLNPTVAGTVAFTDISTNTSVVSRDVGGTTVTGGIKLATFYCCASNKEQRINLSDMQIVLVPGDRLVLSGITNGSTDTVYVGISWREGF